ncbi:MAG: DnaJ domain-containing protein [Oscillospiraceae bacterium]|jgi:hypothetical protein|nr:DnaJ domain-containing protein [Oscillospiraceae bacterium]
MQTREFYQVLGLPDGSTADEVIAAYRRLAKIYHPDLNPGNVRAETKMKHINEAYAALASSALTTRVSSASHAGSNAHIAAEVISDYFDAIRLGDHATAYSYVSEFDKRYVTIQSFKEWRESVTRLFRIRSFRVAGVDDAPNVTLRRGLDATGKRVIVSISEQNCQTGELDRFHATKYCILEGSEWRVLLGYRDLNEIARVFENLSAKYETNDMQQNWDEYCETHCRALGILSKTGLIRESSKEIYRAKRLKIPLFAAVFRLSVTADSDERVLRKASESIRRSIRTTDICAYLGGGAFAVLYCGLRKRSAASVTARLRSRLEHIVPAACGFEQISDSLEPFLSRQ